MNCTTNVLDLARFYLYNMSLMITAAFGLAGNGVHWEPHTNQYAIRSEDVCPSWKVRGIPRNCVGR